MTILITTSFNQLPNDRIIYFPSNSGDNQLWSSIENNIIYALVFHTIFICHVYTRFLFRIIEYARFTFYLIFLFCRSRFHLVHWQFWNCKGLKWNLVRFYGQIWTILEDSAIRSTYGYFLRLPPAFSNRFLTNNNNGEQLKGWLRCDGIKRSAR